MKQGQTKPAHSVKTGKYNINGLPELRHLNDLLTHLQPVHLRNLNWDVHNLFARKPSTEMFKICISVQPKLKHLQTVYLCDLNGDIQNLFTYTTWPEMFTTCLPVCSELRRLNPICLYPSLNWDIPNMFTYTPWTEMFTTCLPACPELVCLQLLYLCSLN